ncbi:MAG: hypothetical protein ABFC96_09370 [Thermoguttaceae bacterium]
MPLNRRSIPVAALLMFACAVASALVLTACSPADAKRPADQRPSIELAQVQPVAPAAQPVAPAPKIGAAAAPMPPAPKVSTFAPAKDLVRAADKYIAGLQEVVENEEDYKDGQDKVAKDANTLVVIALALGLHDEENSYKANAAAVMKAASELAATKDFASAKKAVCAVREAADGKTKVETPLKWEKVASLPELMKQVPLVNTKLKRNIKPDKFKKKAKDAASATAVIAAIAQGSMADTSAAKTPDQAPQWYKFAAAMRDNAGQLNAAIHKKDEPAAAKAMTKLAKSCDDCHEVFHPGVKTE